METTIKTLRPPKTLLEVYRILPEGTLAQLITNQLIISPAPTDTHQKVLMDIANRLYNHLSKNPVGQIRIAPYDVYLDRKNAYQPDIIFVLNENLGKIKESGLHGAPDLVIEILSPKTARYDHEEKMDVYAQKGVKEYWLIDPHEKIAKGYWVFEEEFHEFANNTGVINSKLMKKKFKF